ncbi:unnamed protein product [Fraxinus pennsylvanica]|uniref:Uncharacterized protein n=1 Tax=Fraxinus pennsylvanica TaxID=56036 RepID=A0AAD2EFB3_9LAMI|nr:unnamed protein product [Fraxinus pennsylvanica]
MPVRRNISRRGSRKKMPVCGARVEHPPPVLQLNNEEEHEPQKSETHVDYCQLKITQEFGDSPSPSIPQTLNWGPGGARSRTRHGLANGRKAARRISRVADYLDISGKNEEVGHVLRHSSYYD